MIEIFSSAYINIQEWMMRQIVIPFLYRFDAMSYAEDSVDGLDWFLFGLVQVFIIALVLSPLEKFIPVERYSSSRVEKSRVAYAKATDIFYTLIHRLGILKLVLFLVFSDSFFYFDAQLHDLGFHRLNVEAWIPGLTSIPWVSFFIYMVVLDLGEYLYHRASHQWNWWWQLHALHHSQKYMSVWSDNRNHVLDDLGHSVVFAFIALMIGVEPSQYLWLIAISQLIQSWQHGNFNVDHGFLKYFLISPKFHRLHHAIGMGYEVPGKPGVLGGCNFGILFPWWDMILRTAVFDNKVYPTGVKGLNMSNNPLIQQWQSVVNIMKLFKGSTHND
jgi:sterol desaturase/sphingolipid hydroxylase (fatty acid hydroxylase superfamily)